MSQTNDQITEQIKNRRTFAIISHPDAGKTTLTAVSYTHLTLPTTPYV